MIYAEYREIPRDTNFITRDTARYRRIPILTHEIIKKVNNYNKLHQTQVRSFYCIYGETVNTASRLCRYANAGQILCSTGFVACLEAERAARTPDENATLPRIAWLSRGHTLLKGFAQTIETFSISVHGGIQGERVAGGDGGRTESLQLKGGEAYSMSFNVDAFNSASSIAQKRRASGRQLSDGVCMWMCGCVGVWVCGCV
jgi:hypothetical protein